MNHPRGSWTQPYYLFTTESDRSCQTYLIARLALAAVSSAFRNETWSVRDAAQVSLGSAVTSSTKDKLIVHRLAAEESLKKGPRRQLPGLMSTQAEYPLLCMKL